MAASIGGSKTAGRTYLEAWGKPVAFYSDKHGVFRVNHPGALGGDGMTQFGRALHALNIDIICANSSPAKGRAERANTSLQDRLVKELQGLVGALAPPLRRARIGADDVDVERVQGAAELGHPVSAKRSWMVDPEDPIVD